MSTMYSRSTRAAKETKGQAKLVLEALSTDEPRTIEDITARITAAGLVTVQQHQRIAAYYLAIFKKSGVVRVHVTQAADEPDVAEEVATPANPSGDEDNGDNGDEDTDEDEDGDEDDEDEETVEAKPSRRSAARR